MNRIEIQRNLSNILNNSIEASDHLDRIKIKINSYVEGNNYILKFEDNGTGFPQNVINGFGLTKVSTKGKERGLGLLHTHSTIKKMGADVKIFNSQHGATTRFIFPIKLNKKIYLIDDDRLTHLSWKKSAKVNELNIVSFYNSETFKNFIELEKINYSNLIYIYLNLNNENGYDLAKYLHQKGFDNLHLATGDAEYFVDEDDILKSIQGKEFPLRN